MGLAGHHLYPIRAQFPNVISGLTQWVTVGYLPHLKPRHAMTRAESDKLRAVRNQVQQRCLAVLLDRFIDASRDGEAVVLREHGACTVFPRVCLYVADLPQEQNVLGLMLNRCMRLCSYCLATKDEIGSPGLHIQERSVATALAVQMDAARLFSKKPGSARLLQIAASHSATPFVPVLGAVHGLGAGTMALFKIMSFDNLHVRLMCSFPLGYVLRAIRAHSNVFCAILAWQPRWHSALTHRRQSYGTAAWVLTLSPSR